MTTIQIPPSGLAAEFTFGVPAPDGMTTLGGLRLYFTFAIARPPLFSVELALDGVAMDTAVSGSGPVSLVQIAQFQTALTAPAQAVLRLNGTSTLDPGNTVTAYAWGAQTASGSGALNPDEGGQPSTLTAVIEVGSMEVLGWPEWNRLTGADQGGS